MNHVAENTYHDLYVLLEAEFRAIGNLPIIADVLDMVRFALPIPVEYLGAILDLMNGKSDCDKAFLRRLVRVAETLQPNGKWDPEQAKQLLVEFSGGVR